MICKYTTYYSYPNILTQKNVFHKPCETWIWGESPKKLKKDELH